MALIKRVAETFVYRYTRKEVSWDLLQPLFDELVIRERDRLIKRPGGHEKTKTVRFVDERPYYFRKAIRSAVSDFLNPPTIKCSREWTVKNFDLVVDQAKKRKKEAAKHVPKDCCRAQKTVKVVLIFLLLRL